MIIPPPASCVPFLLLLKLLFFSITHAFSPPTIATLSRLGQPYHHTIGRSLSKLHVVPDPTSLASATTTDGTPFSSHLILSAVEVFDGSQITNPVVVSNVYWSNLQSNMLSFLLGQLFAAFAFLTLLALFGSQFSQLSTIVANAMSPSDQQQQPLKVPPPDRGERNDPTFSSTAAPPPDWTKLLLCVLIDIIGTSSEAIPIVGELSDVIWAPIAALALRELFHNNTALGLLEFTEEILPLTDVLPLATICWWIDTFARDSAVARVLGLGVYAASAGDPWQDDSSNSNDVVDVTATTTERQQLPPRAATRTTRED